MAQPVEVDRLLRRILRLIELGTSPRLVLLLVSELIAALPSPPSAYVSFLIEIGDRIPGLPIPKTADGIRPEALHDVREILGRWAQLDDAADDWLEAVQCLEARQWAYLGDFGRSLAVLGISMASILPPAVALEDDRSRSAFFESAGLYGDPAAQQCLHFMMAEWDRKPRARETSVLVPVIERPVTGQYLFPGTLRLLRLRILGTAKGAEDEIGADVAVFGQLEGDSVTAVAVCAARRLMEEEGMAHATRRYFGRIDFEADRGRHSGRSANLAMAFLAYCAFSNYAGGRRRQYPRNGVAITGDLDEEGNVLPVNTEALEAKVEGAFFSNVTLLVVPKAQQPMAEKWTEELRAVYPGKRASVAGVGHLGELFYDRRIVEVVDIPRTKYAGLVVWKKKRQLASVLAISVLLLIIVRLVIGPIDSNPVRYAVEGRQLLLQNAAGVTVDNLPLTEEVQPEQVGGAIELVAYHDVTGDGINEAFWIDLVLRDGIPSTLHCYDPASGEELWVDTLLVSVAYPRKPETRSPYFSPSKLRAGDLDGSGSAEIYVLASHRPYFPSVVLKYDAETGARLGRYLHSGRLSEIKTADLDGDGVQEILVSGTHQETGDAVLAVLDSRYVTGTGPSGGSYTVADALHGVEKWYVRFPRTQVGQLFRHVIRSSPAGTFFVREDEIEVRITEVDLSAFVGVALEVDTVSSRLRPDSTETPSIVPRDLLESLEGVLLPPNGVVIVKLSKDLVILSVASNSGLDGIRDHLAEQGLLNHAQRGEGFDWDRYKQDIRYWSGREWSSEPRQGNAFRSYMDRDQRTGDAASASDSMQVN